MAVKIIRQFLGERRPKLPPSPQGLKEYINQLAHQMGKPITEQEAETLAAEFSPTTGVTETEPPKTPRKRR